MPTPTTVTSQIIEPQSETVDELERAVEGAVVHIQGPETVTGLKTFTQAVTAPEFIGPMRGGILDGLLLSNLDLNGFDLVGFTGGEFLLLSASSAAGRSVLNVNTPDFNSYLKVTDLGAAVLESPAQVLIDIGAEPLLGNPGSNGYVLSSTAAGERSWVAQSESGGSVATDTIWDAKGDLAVGTGADTAERLAVGANDTILIADSTQTTGLRWGTPASIRTALGLVIGTNVQAFDADLSSWAAITRASGFDLFTTTPTSANLRALVTGDTGTGGLFFSNGNIGVATGISLALTSDIQAANLIAIASNFDLVNTTATTVNFAGAATALNIGLAASGVTILKSPTVSLTGTLLQPVTAYNTNIGSLSKKFLSIHAAELWVETLVAQDTLATIGGRILVGPTTALIADLSTVATTIDVKHNNLADGDVVYMEASGKVEFIEILSGPTTITGGFRYTVDRDEDESGANQWFAGDAVFNTGQTGSGFIDLYSLRGIKSGTEAGPTVVGNVRNSAIYNDWSARWAIGNLKGLYDYSADTFGAAFGRYGTANRSWLAIDSTNGIRIGNNTTILGQWDADGNLTLGQVANNSANAYWNNSTKQLQFRASTNGTVVNTYIDTDGSFIASAGAIRLHPDGLFLASNVAGGNIRWQDGAAEIAFLTSTYNATLSLLALSNYLKVADTTKYATTEISAANNSLTNVVTFSLISHGTVHATKPGEGYAILAGNPGGTLKGLAIGSQAFATHMLDVYGTGWFQSVLTAASTLTVAGASAASTPAQILTGAWFTGGTGTTTMPHLLLRATGTTAGTTWSTAGTAFGINAVTGFTGNFVDFKLAGAGDSAFKISATGAAKLIPGTDEALTIGGTSGTSRYFRMTEIAANNDFVGGYLQQHGGLNTFIIGVHATTDALTASDISVIELTRATGAMRVNTNLGMGTSTFGTDAVGVIALANGTVPSTSPADMVQLFSVDLSAGNATLGLRTETAVVTEAVTSDRTLSVRVNGTTYKILLKV